MDGRLMAIALLVAACRSDVTIDLSSPVKAGETLCAIMASGQIEKLVELIPWPQLVDTCNHMERTRECGGAQGAIYGCKLPLDKRYPSCTEERVRNEMRDLAAEIGRARATCSAEVARERPNGSVQLQITLLPGVRDTIDVEKSAEGKWVVRKLFLLHTRLAALDAKIERKLGD